MPDLSEVLLSDLERTLAELRENRARLAELVQDMPVECLVGPVCVVLTSDHQFAVLSDALEDQIDVRRGSTSPARMHGAGGFSK